jgi:ATP dependent DNA ligase domain
MHPTLVREPFHRDGWVFEEKYDGWRMIAVKDSERVRLVSRNGRDRAGISRHAAMAISGHKTEAMYQRYNIVSESDLRAAAQRVQTYVDTLPVRRREA